MRKERVSVFSKLLELQTREQLSKNFYHLRSRTFHRKIKRKIFPCLAAFYNLLGHSFFFSREFVLGAGNKVVEGVGKLMN